MGEEGSGLNEEGLVQRCFIHHGTAKEDVYAAKFVGSVRCVYGQSFSAQPWKALGSQVAL